MYTLFMLAVIILAIPVALWLIGGLLSALGSDASQPTRQQREQQQALEEERRLEEEAERPLREAKQVVGEAFGLMMRLAADSPEHAEAEELYRKAEQRVSEMERADDEAKAAQQHEQARQDLEALKRRQQRQPSTTTVPTAVPVMEHIGRAVGRAARSLWRRLRSGRTSR